jgi:hypothetical protein
VSGVFFSGGIFRWDAGCEVGVVMSGGFYKQTNNFSL